MAPVYFDELDMVENMHQHYRALGGYTYAFVDYYYAGITEFLDSEAVKESMKIMDVITFKGCYEIFWSPKSKNKKNIKNKYFFTILVAKNIFKKSILKYAL